ncbi:uncharacterized protein LOC109838408 [Asparagus officinalis]|uniref:uncharacterized protein LOC109838408 n=1 Tax=Asparagus officinalis TaxID=4686 RepID=UPI00098E790C|nr:uncharacterized protein LOC109838408 [Asparagus officinalis]
MQIYAAHTCGCIVLISSMKLRKLDSHIRCTYMWLHSSHFEHETSCVNYVKKIQLLIQFPPILPICLFICAHVNACIISFALEREIAAAAEKLAECQETIFLLGRQLNSLRPPSESLGSSSNSRQPMSDGVLEDEPSADGFTIRQATLSPQHFDQFEIENITTSVALSTGGESPLNGYNSYMSLPDTESGPFPKSPLESRHQKHKVTRSSSSSSSAEKHGRGFSRFFSKGRSEH